MSWINPLEAGDTHTSTNSHTHTCTHGEAKHTHTIINTHSRTKKTQTHTTKDETHSHLTPDQMYKHTHSLTKTHKQKEVCAQTHKKHAHSNTKDARTISCGSICLKHTHMRTVVVNTLKHKHALIHAHTCLQTHTHTHTHKHTLTQQTHDKPIKIKRINSPEARDTSLFKEAKGWGRSPL